MSREKPPGHRDRRAERPRDRRPERRPHQDRPRHNEVRADWVFGAHAVAAALANPRRTLKRLAVIPALEPAWAERAAAAGVPLEILDATAIAQTLPPGAVHQGVALLASPPAPVTLEALLASDVDGARCVVVLDQVTDPHNVGAILRSAAAFAAGAVIVQDRHAPELGGTVAKAASGAADRVPYVRVVNIARALDDLRDAGFRLLGLAEEATLTLADAADPGSRTALVLGAEGDGLRRLTRERCDVLARLPTRPEFPSLNVSNAAAIALYALSGAGAAR